jgi:hypothetical protein
MELSQLQTICARVHLVQARLVADLIALVLFDYPLLVRASNTFDGVTLLVPVVKQFGT